ncbi:MAG: glycoside hydrolase family 25 protein [Oscillospiraceae bacterium]
MKKIRCLIPALALVLLLGGCGGKETLYDPYEGMVQVESGFGTQMWVKEYEDVPVSTFAPEDFSENGGRVVYTGSGHSAAAGIDVSEHQGAIDWDAVAADGIDFAVIRAGYRGYSEGGLFLDNYFFDNMDGALRNGLDIGVYFFSQATTPQEAEEEARFLIGYLDMYMPEVYTLPIFYDWESIVSDEARTDGMTGEQITACAVAFCQAVEAAGYTPGVYAYRNLAYYSYDLSAIAGYPLWMGALGDWPDFYYRHDIWQYSATGRVDGIDGEVDLNLWLREGTEAVPAAAEETDAQSGSAGELWVYPEK